MISILTGLRTGVEFLSQCAASIEAQTHRDWEWLVGVNGFRPNSAVYRHALSMADGDRVRVFDYGRAGPRPAIMHELLAEARGDLIAVLDADDLWAPTKLERQLAENDWDVIGTWGRYTGDAEGTIPSNQAAELTLDAMLEENALIHSSSLMRRECCQWPVTDLLDDYPLWLSLLEQGKRLRNVPEVLTTIRVHPGQHYAGNRDNSAAIREEFRARRGEKQCESP